MSVRGPGWAHPGGDEATVAALSDAVKCYAKELVDASMHVYASSDMMGPYNAEQLLQHEQMVCSVLRLGVRGGGFNEKQAEQDRKGPDGHTAA